MNNFDECDIAAGTHNAFTQDTVECMNVVLMKLIPN